MIQPWPPAALIVLNLVFGGASDSGDFRQSSAEPKVEKGSSHGLTTDSLTVSWETTGDRALPRTIGYELQYASPGRDGSVDATVWQGVEGNMKDTWDITIQVDGYDRLIGRNHTVEDGWFTLALSREYPKPSPLPDLRLITEAIGWDDSWADVENKVQRTLRESRHPQYASWTVAVVRCDETEQRGGNHWAGGCPFLEYGGYTWHLRMYPPVGKEFTELEDYPVITVVKETITAKWSGEGDQVSCTRFVFPQGAGEGDGAHGDGGESIQMSGPPLDLIDPYFCQRGSCVQSLMGLAEATPYLVRLRAYNRNGFGPWTASTTDVRALETMSLRAAEAVPGINTNAAPAAPTPKAPRLSSFTSSSLTVFVDTTGNLMEGSVAGDEIEAFEFEIQLYEESAGRGTRQWTPVIPGNAGDAEDRASRRSLVTASGLSPSTSYRFRVRVKNSYGTSPVSGASEVFTTGPGVPKTPPFAPVVDPALTTSSSMTVGWSSWAAEGDEDANMGGSYIFEAQWEQLGTGYWKNTTTIAFDSESQEWRAMVEGLEAYSQHRFKVRAVNAVGAGEWSAASDWARTEGDPSSVSDLELVEAGTSLRGIPASVLLSASGEGHVPAHATDPDYYHGVGGGGQVGFDGRGGRGGDGAAVIIARVPGVELPVRTSFFFTGSPEQYAVPSYSGVTSVTLKLWGAGGGGVLTPTAAAAGSGGAAGVNATQVRGGGGGFLQAKVKVSPGEILEILVGGGGGGAHGEAGGAGGFNGGHEEWSAVLPSSLDSPNAISDTGGRGGGGAAGGGGSTSVLRRQGQRLVAAAGGGGGAGNAERCCAGGGAGGGKTGRDGGTPAFDRAVVETGGAGTCPNGWCSTPEVEALSVEGIENWITTGGGGGNSTQGGKRGNSDVYDWVEGGGGRQGAVASPRGGEIAIPTVFRGTSSRTATPGGLIYGGIGANGARAGGGGGGGFYGGGGGGSGRQGGGGGGGSSYADTDALAVGDPMSEWAQAGNALRLVEAGESWAEVEWTRMVDAAPGEEPLFYEVEISKGHGSEDFHPSARINALESHNPVTAASFYRAPGVAPPSTMRAVLVGLDHSSEYNVRVYAVSRLGAGRPSAAFSFSTGPLLTNTWDRVITHSSRPERPGRGLSSPDLDAAGSWDTDLAAIQEGGAFANPPTELRQELPLPRSGHTLAVIAGKLYMFGGVTASTRCSSAMIGSMALGDTPGGAATEDCIGGDYFSSELWEYNPPLKTWTEVIVGGVVPPPRDGHTASVAGSKMIVFGGRGNLSDADHQVGHGSRTTLFDDEWEIDLDPSQNVSVATASPTAIREAAATFIPLVVEKTDAPNAGIAMCLSDMSVNVEIQHNCTGQLRLTLYGPGPPPGDTSEPQNTPRAEPAVLFVGYNGIDDTPEGTDGLGGGGYGTAGTASGLAGGGCGVGMAASFTDSADHGVWECCGKGSPFSGPFKAVDRLLVGRFLHMPAEGEWNLGVLDNTVDGSNGIVTSWSLNLETRPCDWRSALRWSMAASSEDISVPPPRAHHTAAIVDGALYVSGGVGVHGALSDLWRRENASSALSSKGWTLLAEGPGVPLPSAGSRNFHGANLVVSPWGLISSGGMIQGVGVGATLNVRVLDPISKLWRSVAATDGSDVATRPVGRYFSATAMIQESQEHGAGSATEGDDSSVCSLIVFGGKDDWRRLDDLWRLGLRSVRVTTSQQNIQTEELSLTPKRMVEGTTPRPHAMGSWSLAETGRYQRCAHLLVAGTANDTWYASCGGGADGGGGDGSCTMTLVLETAWCLGEYQGVGSLH